jgi:hypothetical protein
MPNDTSPNTILATTLFERAIGRRLAAQVFEETTPVRSSTGRLTHAPVVAIEGVKAKVKDHPFSDVLGETDWIDIPLSHVEARGDVFLLPSSLYGVPYNVAHIAYRAGFDEMPDDARSVIDEIASLIDRGEMGEWSGFDALSDESKNTIARYRKGGERWLT